MALLLERARETSLGRPECHQGHGLTCRVILVWLSTQIHFLLLLFLWTQMRRESMASRLTGAFHHPKFTPCDFAFVHDVLIVCECVIVPIAVTTARCMHRGSVNSSLDLTKISSLRVKEEEQGLSRASLGVCHSV